MFGLMGWWDAAASTVSVGAPPDWASAAGPAQAAADITRSKAFACPRSSRMPASQSKSDWGRVPLMELYDPVTDGGCGLWDEEAAGRVRTEQESNTSGAKVSG